MSLLFPDLLEVVLEPASLALTWRQRDWRGRSDLGRETLDIDQVADASPWGRAIADLDVWLATRKLGPAHGQVIIADQFAHYTVVPWPAGVLKRSELQLIAAVEMEAMFGIDASAYEIEADFSRHGMAVVVCAMPRDLLTQLRDCLNAHKIRPMSLQPRLLASANRWRSRIEADGLVASVEEDRCVIGVLREHQWRSIRGLRVRQADAGELLALIEREQVLQGMEAHPIYLNLHGKVDPSIFAGREGLQILGHGLQVGAQVVKTEGGS